MRLIIITGFLGSGKTSAMLSLAEYLTCENGPGSVVIVENEIGEANVDGRLLSQSNYEIRDLTAGCICCTLSGELIGALEEIRSNINPAWLLIEATGIAHQTIANVISQAMIGLRPFSLVLADAERWDELMEKLPMLICTQLEIADTILLNKVDVVASGEIERIEGEIREISSSPCYRMSALSNELHDLWRKVVENAG